MKKRNFVPSVPNPLEERALLSGFSFPAAMGPVTTLGYRGNWVLTSRTYGEVQNTVNKAIYAFMSDVSKAYNKLGPSAAFYNLVGVGTQGLNGYARGTLLAKLDSIMATAECRLPYGAGRWAMTGGVGLSTRTAPTSLNPAVVALGNQSVAQQMEAVIAFAATPADARTGMESVRENTLNIVGNAPLANPGAIPGTLASYIITFGPGGARDFGLKNT